MRTQFMNRLRLLGSVLSPNPPSVVCAECLEKLPRENANTPDSTRRLLLIKYFLGGEMHAHGRTANGSPFVEYKAKLVEHTERN